MNNYRRGEALKRRITAAQMAHDRPHPEHQANDDEQRFRHSEETAQAHCKQRLGMIDPEKQMNELKNIEGRPAYLMSFTKGMPHDYTTGLLSNPDNYPHFVHAIDSGGPRDFRDVPLSHEDNLGEVRPMKPTADWWKSKKAKAVPTPDSAKYQCESKPNNSPANPRAWESQSAGLAFDLEGPDAQAVTMPPAPPLGSAELTAEMAEVYLQALLRDVHLDTFTAGAQKKREAKKLGLDPEAVNKVMGYANMLDQLDWFNGRKEDDMLSGVQGECGLTAEEARRRRNFDQHAGNVFRGITKGDDVGPYLSQFLLVGNGGINGRDNERSPKEGMITYGAISIDQKVRTALPEKDYMVCWDEWFDVQNGADLRNLERYVEKDDEDKGLFKRRFITTPRDLATYVHYDALYEAYLNAALILLGGGYKFDPGIPFQEADNADHQQGFAHFGGPHILSLVTEVATRALKAVRFQKYNVHRRCRPEVLAARLTKADTLKDIAPELLHMRDDLSALGGKSKPKDVRILEGIAGHNNKQDPSCKMEDNFLLPMAFCEGSPMHPAYGAGHATVAGACVTILKAFFDHAAQFKPDGKSASKAYVADKTGESLREVDVFDKECRPTNLTVEGELNKLASNIAIGRNWAGVHYFTDYWESILMGQRIALGILEEQKIMFGENFSMTVPLFEGGTVRI